MFIVQSFLMLFPFFIWIGMGLNNFNKTLNYALIHFYILGVFICLGMGLSFYNVELEGKYFLDSLLVVWPPVLLGIFLLLSKKKLPQASFNLINNKGSQSVKFVQTFLVLISILIFIKYINSVGAPALWELLVSGGDGYLIRLEKSTNIQGGFIIYSILFNHAPLIMICLLFTQWKGTLANYLFLFSILILSILTLQKAGLVWTLFSLLMAWILVKRRINIGIIFKSIAALYLLVTLLLLMYYQDRSLFELFLLAPSFLLRRLSDIYAYAHIFSLENIPQNMSFFYGKALSNPFGVFNFEPVQYSRILGEMASGISAQNYSYSAFTDAYINFGRVGIIMIHFIIIIKLFFLQAIVMKLKIADAIKLSIYVYLCVHSFQYAMAPYQDLISIKSYVFLVYVIFSYYLWLFLSQLGRKIND
jgi:hypothetical protein